MRQTFKIRRQSFSPGAGLALLSAALFGASTPLAKVLLDDIGPWLLAAVLYLGFPVRIERSPARAVPTASDDSGEIKRFMKEHIDRIVAQRKDYLLELEAIGWNLILDAKRIKQDTAFSESKVMIERPRQSSTNTRRRLLI